jgi:hypothetical protein
MIEISRTVLVNDDPAEPELSRDQVWQGLLLKANDALPYVPVMDACHVLERGDGWLVRDVVVRGVPLRERVTFEPGSRVGFERIRGAERGRIENVIDTDEQGRLTLRFSFALTHEELPEGSEAERAHFAPMVPAYENAVAATLAAVRRSVGEGLPDAPTRNGTTQNGTTQSRADAPEWMIPYYEAVDTLDLEGVLAFHTDDSTATIGNNPTMRGKDELRAGFAQLFGILREMRHTFVRSWEVDGGTSGVLDARVTYVLTNGCAVTVPVITIIARRDGLISDLTFCIDMAPVFAALEPAAAHG